MPRYSSFGLANKVAHITGDHVFAPDEAIASLAAQPPAAPAVLNVTLPGRDSPNPPNDGDSYSLMDPGLLSDGTHQVQVTAAGGSSFATGSGSTFGPSTLGTARIIFTYLAAQNAWMISE